MRRLTRAVLKLLLFPVGASFWLLNPIFSFAAVSQLISLIPSKPGNTIRFWYYKLSLESVGENVTISFGCLFTHQNIRLGTNTRLGPFNTVGYADIGDNVLTAQFVHFLSGSSQHEFSRTDIPINSQPGTLKKINIGSDVWIGTNSVIMDNVSRGCVIGSSSVVTRQFEEYDIAIGNPARVIKNRIHQG